MSNPLSVADKLANTGIGVGGSGGVKEGRVKGRVMDGAGHLMPMVEVMRVAEECVEWIERELTVWDEQQESEGWGSVGEREKALVKDDWREWMLMNEASGSKSKL